MNQHHYLPPLDAHSPRSPGVLHLFHRLYLQEMVAAAQGAELGLAPFLGAAGDGIRVRPG
jgi:hypothetical protein